jgi:hypothetical protein
MNTRNLRKSLLLLVAGGLLSVSLATLAARPTSSSDRVRSLGERLEYQASPEMPSLLPPKLESLARGAVVEFSPAIGESEPFQSQDGAVVGRLFYASAASTPAVPEGEHYLWIGGSREAPQAALVGVKAGAAVPVKVYESPARPGVIWNIGYELDNAGVARQRLWARYCFQVSLPDASGGGYCVEVPAN